MSAWDRFQSLLLSIWPFNDEHDLKVMLWGTVIGIIATLVVTHCYYLLSGNELKEATAKLIAETERVRKIGVASQALMMNQSAGAHTSVARDENGDPTAVSVSVPGGVGRSESQGSGGQAVVGESQK